MGWKGERGHSGPTEKEKHLRRCDGNTSPKILQVEKHDGLSWGEGGGVSKWRRIFRFFLCTSGWRQKTNIQRNRVSMRIQIGQ